MRNYRFSINLAELLMFVVSVYLAYTIQSIGWVAAACAWASCLSKGISRKEAGDAN